MNTLGIVPLDDRVCMICQSKPATQEYLFDRRHGFGSLFDGMDIHLKCCDDCDRKRFELWFSEPPQLTDYGEYYPHESKLSRFIERLPVNSQEKIYNGADGFKMDAQDWIDLHLGELSDEKKKEYGFDDELFDMEYEV